MIHEEECDYCGLKPSRWYKLEGIRERAGLLRCLEEDPSSVRITGSMGDKRLELNDPQVVESIEKLRWVEFVSETKPETKSETKGQRARPSP